MLGLRLGQDLDVCDLVVQKFELGERVLFQILQLFALKIRRHLEHFHALLQFLLQRVRGAFGVLRANLFDLLFLLAEHPRHARIVFFQSRQLPRQFLHLCRVHPGPAAAEHGRDTTVPTRAHLLLRRLRL